MRTTKYKILALLILVLGVVFSYRENLVFDTEENISNVQQRAEKQKYTPAVEITKNRPKRKSKKEQVNNPKLPYIYSDDPIVEANIIRLKYSVCFSYFMFQNNPNLQMESFYRSKTQQEYFKKSSANCEQLNKIHPEYLLNIGNKGFDLMKDKVATSKLGQMMDWFKKPIGLNFSEKDMIELYGKLGNEYPELILFPFIGTIKYEFDTLFPDLKELLSTTNTEYVAKISSYSKMYLSCQLSNDCGIGSSTMMSLCLFEVYFCVSSFDELFNERLSYGVRADVLLVLPYFKRLYNVD